MSMLRAGWNSSPSGVTNGNDSGVSGSLVTPSGGDSTRRVQYRQQPGGVLVDQSSLLSKRPSPGFEYSGGSRKQARNNQGPWVSSYSDQSNSCQLRGVREESVRCRLQELERALLDDDDDDGGKGGLESETMDGDHDWMETMQSLISSSSSSSSPPLAFSPSPPSASSSTALVEPRQLVLNSLVALSEGRFDNAIAGLYQLRQRCNPRSGDPEQRLFAQLSRSIILRSSPAEVRPPGSSVLLSPEHLLATQKLFEASPCFKLGFMAANMAILDAVRGRRKLHVIDFNLGLGSQYAGLIHELAARGSKSGRTASLRLTAVVVEPTGSTAVGLRMVGERLEKLAEQMGVRCSFQVVSGCRIGELNRARLGCSITEDEDVVVNFAYRLYQIADESVSTENPRDEILRVAKGLQPAVVAVVEQVMNGNTTPLAARFNEVTEYYKSLMEAMDATTMGKAPNSSEKEAVEECLGRRVANAVACEGRERVERCEVAGKWAARLGMAGLEPRPLGSNVLRAVSTKLGAYGKSELTLKEEAGGLCFGWNDRVLTYASAWH